MSSRETSFGYKISQLHRLIRLHTSAALEPLGFAAGHVPFVAELLHGEGLTQDELSARLHIDKAATARALARLEENGFVERRVNPDNRRQKLIFLTHRTRDLREDFLAPLRGLTDMLARGLSDDEKERTLRVLDRMLDNACGRVPKEG